MGCWLALSDRRRDSLEQQRQRRLGEGGFVDRPADRVLPRGVPKLVLRHSICALVEQGFHQRGVTGARGQHQRRSTHRRQVVHAMGVAQPQDVLEVLRGIGLQVTMPRRLAQQERCLQQRNRLVVQAPSAYFCGLLQTSIEVVRMPLRVSVVSVVCTETEPLWFH